MNKSIKAILIGAGVVLLAYGIYTMIQPEASVDLGVVKAEAQDNTNSYITIGLGIVALLFGLIGGKKA